MKLHYWQGFNGHQNFGDELNKIIWPKLISKKLDDDDKHLFLGIGTILNTRIPESTRKTVLGSGVGYGNPPHIDKSWSVLCLRGPLSAQVLGLKKDISITDPGILITRVATYLHKPRYRFAFMPHWLNSNFLWKQVCQELGFLFIDPLWEVSKVLSSLTQTECLITEAMHGAIIADAYRIPWIPIIDDTNPHTLPFKWHDWCQSIFVNYNPCQIPNTRDILTNKNILFYYIRNSSGVKSHIKVIKDISESNLQILSKQSHLNILYERLDEKVLGLLEG
jgi:succinoglycan biosynthesis protein ExoV